MKIHIDIDCFFVSAARTLDPSLENVPVAIGGRSDTKIFSKEAKKQSVNFENTGSFVPIFFKSYETKDDDISMFQDEDGKIRGILTTASYEARKYGVKTAMRIQEALQLCPELIIKSPNMTLYQKLSHQLHQFLCSKIPLVEQASIDEFYADLEGWIENEKVENFINTLRLEIKEQLQLPVSIGAAKTRYLAKLATSYAKPFGSQIILEKDYPLLVDPIKVEDFAGVGRSMRKKLHSVHISTLGELKKRKGTLYSWGPYAKELYKRVCGLSDGEIKTSHQRKSIGISRTIDPLYDRNELHRRLHILVRHLSFAIYKFNVIPTVFHLSLSYEMNHKSHKNISSLQLFSEKNLSKLCFNLLKDVDIYKRLHIIRISISCSSFTRNSKKELSLLHFDQQYKMKKYDDTIQSLRAKYAIDILRWGGEFY